MTYSEVLQAARGCSGPYCKACPVCNGRACGSSMPGPGAKGTVAVRNYEAWQSIRLDLDTICENKPVDTRYTFFGQQYDLPVMAHWFPQICRPGGRHQAALRRKI